MQKIYHIEDDEITLDLLGWLSGRLLLSSRLLSGITSFGSVPDGFIDEDSNGNFYKREDKDFLVILEMKKQPYLTIVRRDDYFNSARHRINHLLKGFKHLPDDWRKAVLRETL